MSGLQLGTIRYGEIVNPVLPSECSNVKVTIEFPDGVTFTAVADIAGLEISTELQELEYSWDGPVVDRRPEQYWRAALIGKSPATFSLNG